MDEAEGFSVATDAAIFAKERLGKPEEIVAIIVDTHSLEIAYSRPMAGV